MKNAYLLIILILNTTSTFCQTNNAVKKAPAPTKPDTIVYYQVDSESMSLIGGEVAYKVNNKIVTQQQWQKMTIGNSQMKTCTPCIVKTYDANDTLLSIAMQYKWCQIGTYTAYYSDDRVKITGQYKGYMPGKSSPHQYCGIKDGIWTYYDKTGKVTATELYKDGKLIKKTPAE